MPAAPTTPPLPVAVFLSYAREDAPAAQRIADALRAAGVEVWFDQSELRGGDAWDQKIRGQIKECALFLPIISANTQTRTEGYFRLEWRLADRRTELMGKAKAFLVPVCIDATRDSDADVPDSFLAVQWTRLPAGEVNAAFCERVKTLLAGPSESSRTRPAFPVNAPEKIRPAPTPAPSAAWPRLALGVLAVLVVVVALYIALRPRRSPEEIAKIVENAQTLAANAAAKSAPAPQPASEAAKLVAQTWVLLNKTELARAELEAADELCKRAAALEPTSIDVLAAWSQVDSWMIYLKVDDTAARRDAARTKAARAVQLAPDSFEARLAQACFLVRGRSNEGVPDSIVEVETSLHALLRERPAEPRALLTLGILLRNAGRTADARGAFEELAKNPTRAALAWNEIGWNDWFAGDLRAAEEAADKSIGLQPYWANLSLRVYLALYWRGDLELTQRTLERLPRTFLQDDQGLNVAGNVAWFRRDWPGLLRLLADTPRDWLTGFNPGPKAVFAALTHEQAGHVEAARIEWQAALKLVEQRLAEKPNAPELLRMKGRILANLGERAEAEKLLQLARDLDVQGDPRQQLADQLALGHLDESVALLERVAGKAVLAANVTAAVLRLDPTFDPLRTLPRFQALQARLDADPRFSPNAKETSSASAAPRAAADKSVAVLAFADNSPAHDSEYFSDGISEELINALGKVPGLKVPARTSSFYFKGKNVPVPEIAEKLGVAYVIEGSVQRAGERVKISARLTKAADGFQVWTDSFTRDAKDVFAVEEEIAGLIAKNLSLTLGSAARETKQVNPEVHRLVLEGRYFWNQRNDEGFARAEAAFTKAIELDPQSALAHSGLASVCLIREAYNQIDGFNANATETARAREEAQRAITLDPTLAEPHGVLGFAWMMERRLREAEEEFQRGLALNPSDAVVRSWHGNTLAAEGRVEAALAEYEKAAELDPLWFINFQVYAWQLRIARRYEEALRVLAHASTLRSEIYIPSDGRRASLLWLLGRADEAVAAARFVCQHPDVRPRWDADALAIAVLRDAGHQEEAQNYAGEVLQRLPADSYMRGMILVQLDRFDEALPFLERMPVQMTRSLLYDQKWDRWRDEPRFQQLLAKLGCTEEYKVARESLARLIRGQAAKK